MKKKCFRLLLKFITKSIEIALAFSFVLFVLAFIRLAKTPVELKYLTPVLSDVLTPKNSDLTVQIGKVYLGLGLKRGRLVDITVADLKVVRPDDSVLASIPEGYISFSLYRLLNGEFVPTSVELNRPYLSLILNPDDSKSSFVSSSDQSFDALLPTILSLEDIVIEEGQVTLERKGQEPFNLSRVDFLLKRNWADDASVKSVVQIGGGTLSSLVKLDGFYHQRSKILTFDGAFKNLKLPEFRFFSDLIGGFQLNVDGHVQGQLNLNKKGNPRHVVESLSFEITSNEKGNVYLPKPLDITYPVHHTLLKGAFTPALESLLISQSFLEVRGSTANVAVDIQGIGDFLDSRRFGFVHTVVTADVTQMPIDLVPDVWPSSLGPNAYNWVKNNIHKGMVTNSHFVLTLFGEKLLKVMGVLQVKGATVRYVDTMPAVENVDGQVTLQLNRVDIDATQGHIGDLKLKSAVLNFTDVDKDDPFAHMEIQAVGPISQALEVINSPPLYFADDFEINPKKTHGTGDVAVMLDFPISGEKDLQAEDIQVSVNADLSDVSTPAPSTSFLLNKGQFNLFVNNDGLKITGTALFDDKISATASCQKNFKDTSKFEIACQINSVFDGQLLQSYNPFFEGLIKGNLRVDLSLQQYNSGISQINIKTDLMASEVALWPLSYTKKANQAASAEVQFIFKDGDLLQMPLFSFLVPKENVEIRGNAELSQGTILHLPVVRAPKTQASILFSEKDKKSFSLSIDGDSLDISGFVHHEWLKSKDEQENKSLKIVPSQIQISAYLKKLFLSKQPFEQVSIELEKNKGLWHKINVYAKANENYLSADLVKGKDLYVSSPDIGHILKIMGVTEHFKGGVLKSDIEQNSKGELNGILSVKKYQLTDVSFLMKAATILGILNAFSNDTIDFKKANIPFEFSSQHVLTIKDGVASGTDLGLTFKGTITMDTIDLKGSVIPAYLINSLLGKIPFVGRVFVGDEGGGLIGLSFHVLGVLRNPEVSFSPSSLLTPGVIRNVFE